MTHFGKPYQTRALLGVVLVGLVAAIACSNNSSQLQLCYSLGDGGSNQCAWTGAQGVGGCAGEQSGSCPASGLVGCCLYSEADSGGGLATRGRREPASATGIVAGDRVTHSVRPGPSPPPPG